MSNLPKFRFLSFSRGSKADSSAVTNKIKAEIRPYVDDEYYLLHNPDVREAKLDPTDHYLRHGWREGRNPNAIFDTNFYIQHHMISLEKHYCPLIHYAAEGEKLRLSTKNFDPPQNSPQNRIEGVFGFIEQFFTVPVLSNPILAGEENRWILFRMFSPAYYREKKAEKSLSDNEALARYLTFDLESGMEPGPLFVNEHYIRVAESRGYNLVLKVPFLHWLEYGLPNRISPNPLYSEEEYLALNPDLTHPVPWPKWAFLHFIEHGIYEGRLISRHLSLPAYSTQALNDAPKPMVVDFLNSASRKPKIYDEIARIDGFRKSNLFEELVASTLEIDPAIGPVRRNTPSHIPPLHDAAFRDFQEILKLIPDGNYDAIIFMPFCKMGGADFIAGCLTHVLNETEKVLILRTDQSEWSCPHWFPKCVVTVDLSRHLSFLDERTRTRILYELTRKIGPKAIFNVNSRICFEMYVRYGSRAKLFSDIYAYYFCSDRDEEGVEVGYPVRYFGQIIEHLRGAFVDNASLVNTLVQRFSLPEEISRKVKVAYTPMMSKASRDSFAEKQVESSGRRINPVLLWAGRFDRQKRFDILIEIARRFPQVTFKCWGKPVLDSLPDLSKVPENVEIFPPFKNLDELPLNESDGWLYTSEWDGLPTILIECGGLGLPIVASDVGGVGELIDEETGWPVRDAKSVDAYVVAIMDMLARPQERVRRAGNLKQAVLTRHTMDSYKETIRSVTGIEQEQENV